MNIFTNNENYLQKRDDNNVRFAVIVTSGRFRTVNKSDIECDIFWCRANVLREYCDGI